jgi:hypothetical protein
MSSGKKPARKFGFPEIVIVVVGFTPITAMVLRVVGAIEVQDSVFWPSTVVLLGGVFSQSLQYLRDRSKNEPAVEPMARTEIVRRPQDKLEYERLWGGFVGFYYAYNPKYFLENIPETGWSEIIKTFESRFEDRNFRKAVYIFLTGDEAGRKHLADFCSKILALRCYAQVLEEKLEIIEIPDRCSSQEPSIYLGTREDSQVAIRELCGSSHLSVQTHGGVGEPSLPGASDFYLLHTEEKGQTGGYCSWLKDRFDSLILTYRKQRRVRRVRSKQSGVILELLGG